MKSIRDLLKNKKNSQLILLLSLAVSVFWVIGRVANVYRFAWLGAIFELLWLPMLALIPLLLVLTVVGWAINRFKLRSIYFACLLLFLLAGLMMC